MPGGPHYGWYNDAGVLVKGTVVSGAQYTELAKATADGLVKTGATGQSSAKLFGDTASTRGSKIVGAIDTADQAAKGNWIAAMSKAKVLPALSTLGKVSNVATAAWLGWEIGSEIRDLFTDEVTPNPAPGPVAMVGQDFVAPGSQIASSNAEAVVNAKAGGTCAVMKESGQTLGASACTALTWREDMPGKECKAAGLQDQWIALGGGNATIPPARGVIVQSPTYAQNAPTLDCRTKVGYYYVPILAATVGLGNGFKGATSKTGTAPGPVLAGPTETAASEILKDPEYNPSTGVIAALAPKLVGQGSVTDAGAVITTVPEPPPGVKYREYEKEVEEAYLTPQATPLPDYAADPTRGPEEVTAVNPVPGTEVTPGSVVRIRYNPEDAPEAAGGAPWSPPTIPAIDMSPLSGIPSPCTVFPFGLFCWVGEALAQFNVDAVCPHVAIPVEPANTDFDVTLCGDYSEQMMGYIRPVLLFAFILGCGFLFARGTRAVGGD